MALTSHHRVHPVRRTFGLAILFAIVLAVIIASWRQNRLADGIESSFRRYFEQRNEVLVRP